ncbi:helix-turn-helix transcriptional regulator [Congregibacter litoralis]|uniref:Putative transcriptional regulator n=1 Tax=Congregibacter litoralis KT71 TaxID=314285 RepID=A4A3P8_9GAMM|nr:WYL domain-containing protein [Congregibacter litoralis]EAQ99321.1 putative transcriptional regulator [Congregibacter litoralis KT71]
MDLWPYRWDHLLRYRYIETISLWEGRLTTGHLTRCFGIGRQQASKDINFYLREIAPGNISYDKYLKGYRPSADFVPRVTRGTADEYLHLMSRDEQLMGVFESLPLATANVEQLTPPGRDVAPSILRPMIQAARARKRLEVDYVSLKNPDREGRIIVPHTLVFTGYRWHVRAWCEKNQGFRDFVLSRFRGDAEILDDSTYGEDQDSDWLQRVTIIVTPDPRLSKAQQEVIAHDYGMSDGKLRLETRATLVNYQLQLLQLDPRAHQDNPLAQQIVLENHEALTPWLFT